MTLNEVQQLEKLIAKFRKDYEKKYPEHEDRLYLIHLVIKEELGYQDPSFYSTKPDMLPTYSGGGYANTSSSPEPGE